MDTVAIGRLGEYRINNIRHTSRCLLDEYGSIKAIQCNIDKSDSWQNISDKGESVTTGVWISGSGVTGDRELYEAWIAEKTFGKQAPTNHVVVISNREKSNARKIAEGCHKPLAQLDFTNWFNDIYHDIKLQNPISGTSIFFPPGCEKPDRTEIEWRFKTRTDFEAALLDKTKDIIGYIPDSHSLRGYSFPMMHDIGQIDDTHPAALDWVDASTGQRLYPGWQDQATQLMINHGHKLFCSSLIYVEPLTDISMLDKVDNGAILALGEGYSKFAKPYDAEVIQNTLKVVDDMPLLALKPWGLFSLFSMTKHDVEVEYKTLNKKPYVKKEKGVSFAGKPMSGKNAFRPSVENLNNLEEALLG
ncbi:MAG: hypothetical protein PHC66_00125 [Candidatus Nanoarchaeia archaeon]|nr:hypothetical protein [Candidatus Nanoarchaeia archaeon]MDD5239645.1 hypothetical protein [Candidatus Nanoarchaeia archaeon]